MAKGDVVVCTFTNYYRELTLTKSATPQFYNKKGDEIAYHHGHEHRCCDAHERRYLRHPVR